MTLAQKSLDTTIYSNSRIFELQKKSVNSQISSLKQTKKYFETEMEPFLQVQVPMVIDTIGVRMPIIFTSTIKNLSKYPVKIEEETSVTITKYSLPSFDSVFRSPNKRNISVNYVNRYITYDSPLQEQVTTPFRLDESYYNAIMNKRLPIYYFGFIKYINLATGQRKEYDYMLRIVFLNNRFTNNEFIINENKKIY